MTEAVGEDVGRIDDRGEGGGRRPGHRICGGTGEVHELQDGYWTA